MAKDIFSKFSFKDYNNLLERILENKNFSEDVKNLLLSMLYKIENAYEDYITVKTNVCTKNEFLRKLIRIIDEKCNDIQFIKNVDEKVYTINRETGSIKVLQNEVVLLEAIIELSQKDIEFNEKYELIGNPLKEMLIEGSKMNQVETIRDFNGWSWDTPIKDMQNINYNVIFQILLILFGNKFMDELLNDVKENDDDEYIPNNEILRSKYNNSFGLTVDETKLEEDVDYIEEMKKKLKEEFGEELYLEFWKTLIKNIIVIYANKNMEYKENVIQRQLDKKEKIEKMKDNKTFLEEISKNKKDINNKIREIDELLNDETALKKEYIERNKKLENKDKIFSVSHLAIMLEKQREELLKQIKDLNKLMEPREFLVKKEQISKKLDFYEDLELDKEDENEQDKINELKKVFLKCFNVRIKKANKKEEVEKLIYELRYFELLPINVYETKEYKEELIETEDILLKKACEMKIFLKFSENEKLNNDILRNIFTSRIMKLQNIIISLAYNEGLLSIEIYDGNIHDKTVELPIKQKTELAVKLKRKIKIWVK